MGRRTIIGIAIALPVAVAIVIGVAWWAYQRTPEAQPGEACITDHELLGNVARGFFIAQELQAERCDRYLETAGRADAARQREAHAGIMAKFEDRISELRMAEAAYFERRYGDEAEYRHQYGLARTRETYMADVRADAMTCERWADELAVRLDSDWSYIEAKLRHGMGVVRRTQAGMKECER